MSSEDSYLAFSCAPFIGPKRFISLMSLSSSVEEAWNSDRNIFREAGISEKIYDHVQHFKNAFNIAEYRQRLRKLKIEYISQADQRYPKQFHSLDNPPIGIFVRGNYELLSGNCIGVVGSRKITAYGLKVTQVIVQELAAHGIVIVSGLALGVDAVAHEAAIERGQTISVLGCGVDCPYPQENSQLYRTIYERGGLILSEYPLSMTPTKGSFPARNRIIAALSRGILVTEASERSGSLITAQLGKILSKYIFAVPGPITSVQSHGTNELIKNGAIPVSHADDILKTFQMQAKLSDNIRSFDQFSSEQQKILDLLQHEPLLIDQVRIQSQIPLNQLSVLIAELEMDGVITQTSNGKLSLN